MILPGTRVLAFDSSLFIDDRQTPLSVTMRMATVLCRYGKEYRVTGKYPDLVDLKFDHRDRISKAHFTSGVKESPPAPAATGV